MLDKLYEAMYLKAFVNIVISPSKTTVYIEMLNKKDIVNSSEEVFETKHFSIEMREYILSFTKETPFFYISILDNSTSQGVIPTCAKNKVGYFYDVSASEHKCYNDKWTYYTSKSDIYAIEKIYEKIGTDFIFSPFVVLANFFKDKINSHLAMFILIEEGAISLSIFNNSQLLYGNYLDIEVDLETSDELIMDEIEDDMDIDLDESSIDLDDIDSIDELDDFGDIADLDAIDDIDEFSETKDVQAELEEREDEVEFSEDVSVGLNEDYKRFVLIQSSVNDFYKDEKYSSEFIENTYIADTVGLSSDLKKLLEEEMFLNVYVRHIDLMREVCEVAKMEVS